MRGHTKGPWDQEPDELKFIASGLDCEMHRHPSLKHWCGYVRIPAEHPLHGKDYDTPDVDVHGGLTWARRRPGCIRAKDDDGWWFGFDCAHAWDLCPGSPSAVDDCDDVYRNMAYVKTQCEKLASQLAAIAKATGGDA